MKQVATSVKHLLRILWKVISLPLAINSIPHRLASNRVFGVKLWQMIINICLFVTIIVWPIVLFLIKIFHLLTWKPAAGVSHKSPLQRHRVTGDQNLSQYVLGNPKSLLLLEMWYMIRQYQSIFIKTCL